MHYSFNLSRVARKYSLADCIIVLRQNLYTFTDFSYQVNHETLLINRHVLSFWPTYLKSGSRELTECTEYSLLWKCGRALWRSESPWMQWYMVLVTCSLQVLFVMEGKHGISYLQTMQGIAPGPVEILHSMLAFKVAQLLCFARVKLMPQCTSRYNL